jgi:hypothetical protein
LSDALAALLDRLADQPGVLPYAFLVDDTGQTVLATCPSDDPWLAMLGRLTASRGTLTGPLAVQHDAVVPDPPVDIDHILYIATIFENLLLGLLAPAPTDQQPTAEIWQRLEQTTDLIRSAIADNAFVKSNLPIPEQQNIWLPLRLSSLGALGDPIPGPARDEIAVNWAAISNNSEILSRLQRILSG